MPFFDVKKPKAKINKRHQSSLEIIHKEKQNDETMNALSKHLNGEKITRANLLVMADHLSQTNQSLPKIGKSSCKEQIYNWFRSNWKAISSSLGTVNCLAPNGFEISETEDELFLIESDDLE